MTAAVQAAPRPRGARAATVARLAPTPPRTGWLLAALLAAAAGVGVATSLLGPGLAALLLVAALPLPLILHDYRLGVAMLAFLLPAAAMLPPVRGLNPLNFLTVATLASFFLREGFLPRAASAAGRVVPLPAALLACFLLPATWAIVVAWPHIPEAAHNYPSLADAQEIYDPRAYVIARYAKPVFYYFSFAFLLANAVRRSERPERFVLLLAAAMMAPAIAVFYTVATYPGTLGDVARNREFMAPRGMHANEFGMLLAISAGPLLFVGSHARRASWRWTLRAAFAVVTVALLLTFSRGGLLAWLVAVAGFLWHRRRVRTLLAGVLVGALLVVAAPTAMKARFETGLHAGALGEVRNVSEDDLTAGRVHGWLLLAPEVLESPWIGRGLGSTQWSTAVATGRYKADHPHNIYLEILMDVGIVGFAAMAWLHARYVRRMGQLGRDESLSPELRAFFAGARWSLLGLLAMAATTAYYMPNAAQWPFWFSLGMLFAWWRPAPAARRAAGAGERARLSARPAPPRPGCAPAPSRGTARRPRAT